MLHENVVSLLVKHEATIEQFGGGRWWKATINDHKLVWGMDSWSRRIVLVDYYGPGRTTDSDSQNYLLAWPEEKIGNGTKVKRFIQRAVEKEHRQDGVILTFGPDSQHRTMAPSLRARQAGWPGPTCNVRTTEALVMGQAWLSGDCPPEVILDWLKENGHLAEPAEKVAV